MREILFRGKQTDDGEWVEGYFCKKYFQELPHDRCVIQYKTEYDTKMWKPDYMTAEVIPETVGQYTGLTDKNGKKIFEGDVLKIAKLLDSTGTYYFPPLNYPVNVVVKWDMCAWMWETLCEDKRYIGFPEAWCYYECEIIGNIHDNPELLKGGD